ncbi:MAG: DNA polymerase III subunit delta [Rhodobacteraceae bacterium]|nr:DNA polymerase III subunit delta [Paracoccaceae bacterium]
MKLAPRETAAYVAKPDPARAGILLYGPDAMRVALKRQDLVAALLGPSGEAEMRLTRLAPGDLRRDPAALDSAMRAQGFFPGMRIVFIDAAPDTLAATIGAVLQTWRPEDARLVVTAGNLSKGSALRKLFEAHPNALAAAIYADPPGRAEIAAALARAGLAEVPDAAMADLTALAHALDPGDFAQFAEKLALYKLADATPLGAADIAAVAPLSTEAGIDEVLDAVADGRPERLGPTLRRLHDQGVGAVALAIAATRHFRTLHAIAAHPGGASQGIGSVRPPLFGPRRDKLLRQAQGWGAARLEEALAILIEADLSLRSGGATAPQAALIERALFRLTYLGRR